MNSSRFLITGAAGFVGSALTRRLVADGHQVHVLLKSSTPRWRLTDLMPDLRPYDVSLEDETAVRTLVATIKPDVIYHLATHGAYSTQTDADGIIRTNILGTWNLLKAAAHVDFELFVNTGSSSEYGFKDYAMRETDVLEPNSYYSVAKCAQTLLCQHVAKTEKRPIITYRLFSVYGPYEEPSRLVPTVVRRCLQGEDLDLVSPEIARDFVYVDDVVDAYLRFDALANLSGEIINIGTGVGSTIQQVVDLALHHTGAGVTCHWGAMPARIWDATTWVADCTKSHRLLGWRPRTTLSEGLQRTVEWMRRRLEAGTAASVS
jgi:nucleoside-diphosphate-sugar epimerase